MKLPATPDSPGGPPGYPSTALTDPSTELTDESTAAPPPQPRPPMADLTDQEVEAALKAYNADHNKEASPDNFPPEGFAYHCRSHRHAKAPVYLLLPARLAVQYRLADEEWRANFRALCNWRREQRVAAESVPRNPSAFEALAKAAPARSAISDKVGDIQISVDLKDLANPKPGVDYDPRDQLPVFQWSHVKELVLNARVQSADRDGHNRLSGLFFKLKERGCLRRIARFDNLERLAELQQDAPNFSDVIHILRNRWVLSKATGHFHIPPILLLGPPGVGKTRFAQRLAGLLNTGFFRYAMDSGTRGAALLGSDAFWGNSQMGAIADQLIHGSTANPVFVLDEVDKARDDGDRYSAINALHSILEPETAGGLRDLSVRLVLDASRVIWIATANRKEFIPDSLLSRFKVFEIGMPVGEQSLQVARSVVASVLQRLGLNDFDMPGDALLRTIDQQPARGIAQAVEDAVCEAIVQGRRHLLPEDFKTSFGSTRVDATGTSSKPQPARRGPMTLTFYRAQLTAVEDARTDSEGDEDKHDGEEPGKRLLH